MPLSAAFPPRAARQLSTHCGHSLGAAHSSNRPLVLGWLVYVLGGASMFALVSTSAILDFVLGLTLAGGLSGQAYNRGSPEFYLGCARVAAQLPGDYRAMARRRLMEGRNLFLYLSSPLGSGPPLYPGLMDSEWRLPARTQAEIRRGGSWGVQLPDTGCGGIIRFDEEQYFVRYNRYALALFEGERRGD
jgi:hypothetical protein